MRQLILDLLPEAPPSLDNFVTGANGETLSAFVAWLAPDSREPFLLLWGESGSGKTHLLRTCAGQYSDASADPDLAKIDETIFLHAVDNVEALSEVDCPVQAVQPSARLWRSPADVRPPAAATTLVA